MTPSCVSPSPSPYCFTRACDVVISPRLAKRTSFLPPALPLPLRI
jgi:hypothetical protein